MSAVSMPSTLDGRLVVALSSRALFDFESENAHFEKHGPDAYRALQLQHLETPAQPGVAYPLVRKLLAFNADGTERTEVVVLSRNDPVSGLRIFRSTDHLALPVSRGVFTRGTPPFKYLAPLGAHLFLSANSDDVRSALMAGFPAARVYPESYSDASRHPNEVRIAFDGDAVLFSDEAERVFQDKGLTAFVVHEFENAQRALPPGPFKPFLAALHRLRSQSAKTGMTIRTALVTARSAPAHERAVRTLMAWDIQVDEAMFLGGLPKGPFLKEFEPDFFFDDQTGHCESAKDAGPTGHVPAGVNNDADVS